MTHEATARVLGRPSVMRRQLIPQAAKGSRLRLGGLLAQAFDLARQAVDLVLLAHDDGVELVEQVFGEAGLDLEIGQPLFGAVLGAVLGEVFGGVGVFHGPIGREVAAGGISGDGRRRRVDNRT